MLIGASLVRRLPARLVGSVCFLFALILAMGLAAPSAALAGDAFFKGTDIPLDNPDWMADLSDGLLLSQISLPGTHDTMARGCDLLADCQVAPLADQLQAGVRALDIRCASDSGAQGNYFSLWHGPYCRLGTFDQVADDCQTFLAAHPEETIVMRIRQEPALTNPKLLFTDMFKWYRDVKYPGLFADIGDGSTIPTLGQVRGNVVVLQDYDYSPFWGIRYITPGSHPPFDSQDSYVVPFSKAGFDAKWAGIYDHLYATNAGNRTSTWYVNWLSGGTQTYPERVAGGYSGGFSATGMNDRTLALLRGSALLDPPSGSGSAKAPLVRTGTLMMDFPGPGLIQAIINLNPGVPRRFTDVSGSPYETAIYELAARQIILGFQDNTFRPDADVTRQQFAKMIVKTLGLPVTGTEVCRFKDVDAQVGADPFYPSKYVAVCADHNIAYGYPGNLFKPLLSISRQQLITMVARAAALPEPPAGYEPGFFAGQFSADHYQNARKAAYAGLLDGLGGVGPSYDFFAPASRGECAQLLYNLLQEH